jgi:hypothetical protein
VVLRQQGSCISRQVLLLGKTNALLNKISSFQ